VSLPKNQVIPEAPMRMLWEYIDASAPTPTPLYVAFRLYEQTDKEQRLKSKGGRTAQLVNNR